MSSPPRVVVVGGGIAGLTAAHRLRERLGDDVRITVLEQGESLGGKLRTIDLAGTPLDVGAEAFLARRPEVLDLMDRLGLAEEVVHPSAASAQLRAGGRNRPIPRTTIMGVPSSPESVRDVLSDDGIARVAAETTLPPLQWDGGDVALGALLRERLGDEVVRRLVDPLLGGVYAGRSDELGLRATVPALARAFDEGARSVLGAAYDVLPAPADPDTPKPPVFGALRGGYRRLVDELVRVSGARIRLGRPVRALRRDGTHWWLDVGAAVEPEPVAADAVVLAVPAPAARRLLDGVAPGAAANLGRIELASSIVVGLALPADIAPPEHSGVLLAEGEQHADGTPFTAKAFTFSTRKWPHLRGAHGEILMRASVGRYGDADRLRRDDAEFVEAVRADLAELTGIRAEPVETAVTRWGGGLPQYGPGHGALVDGVEREVADLPGLAIAGASLHGVGVPACVGTGEAAADGTVAYLADTALLDGGKM